MLEQPLAMAVRPGDPGLYVAQKTGKVMAIRSGRVDPIPVLDLTEQVSLGSEQGLLGLAFSPSGQRLYVNYTDTNGDTRVTGYAMRESGRMWPRGAMSCSSISRTRTTTEATSRSVRTGTSTSGSGTGGAGAIHTATASP